MTETSGNFNLYRIIRAILFRFDPEKVHDFVMNFMKYASRAGIPALFSGKKFNLPVEAMGLRFPNPVGLAAGLDKNGVAVDFLAALGFGFIEAGTVTPKPQPGNPKPRLFRIPERGALINRMGFNNDGLETVVENLSRRRGDAILGINIGKQKTTPVDEALSDYLTGLKTVYPHADYIAVNISSPNTPDLRELQKETELAGLLKGLSSARSELAEIHKKRKPLVLKVAPDLSEEEIKRIADLLLEYQIDGLITTNTTIGRKGVEDIPVSREEGGLSGKPLYELSNEVLSSFAEKLEDKVTLIAAGGIFSAGDALKKLEAGAKLVQLYTGFIYRGPALIREICLAYDKTYGKGG